MKAGDRDQRKGKGGAVSKKARVSGENKSFLL